jgi:hypothetical protein
MVALNPQGRPTDVADATRPSIDAHVHLHPRLLAQAMERHLAERGWVAAQPFDPEAVAATQRSPARTIP